MPDDLTANVRAALQQVLDAHGDGWHVAQMVVCLGLERVTSHGELAATAWVWAPPGQADWMTDGLLEAAGDLRCVADVEDD